MTTNVLFGRTQQMNLQATLSSCSATADESAVIRPHHPITCASDLRLEPDGSLVCDHAEAPADDQRTRSCLNHSLALLLLELAYEL
jgi:hypothetical protein